jgi:predicted metalloprotease
LNVSINPDANVDPSEVEDMRGGRSGGSGQPGGINFPGLGGGGGGGGGGLGGGGLGAGAGCLTALLPMFKKNPKIGCAVIVIAVICIGGFLCLGGSGKLGNLGGLGDVGVIGGGAPGANEPADNKALQEACSAANPDRFNRTDCRNLLYINSIQAYWQQALPQYFGKPYQKATTRLFSGGVNTACGSASSGMGPFYCPGDNHVYIDLSFYDELARRFGAPGQFAQAYVLAHEYGHHVQTLIGTEAEVRRAQQRDPGNANRYSVAMELQADCYAGAWASAATRTTDATGKPLFTSVTQKDIDEALQAAAAVGDDTIQKQATGTINESGFTHGSAQQRQQWFSQGFQTGDPRQCNTFA